MANDLRNVDSSFDPMDAFFGNFGKSFLSSVSGNQMKTDVVENDDNYEVDSELPGFKKNDIKLYYNDDTLSVRAVHDLTKEDNDKQGNILRRERSSSNISRSFYIPNIDDTKISASYDGGILKITLPKQTKEQQKNTRIEIQ
ncbi:Hsp20/alpha crystallin family protein [Nicoliella spurrieriana]|uniref:Hsp20/alpha crystallin family protein n=1 Tax=Nicoliella spurrieriana TaxID=2925830 RepID=A0A976RST9_9LACO|nr:Hsp20/alpha crystallin family protein [Nicoliella spurrieriana]UQS87173.1 Hsp20/alpha crystallin family protein [Nicoliella spurrieriana]